MQDCSTQQWDICVKARLTHVRVNNMYQHFRVQQQ